LRVIEEILHATKSTNATGNVPGVTDKLVELERYVKSVEEYAMGEVRTLAFNHDMLEKRVEMLESSMRKAADTLITVNETMGSLQRRMDDEKPVEAAEVEAEIEAAQEAALNADVDPITTEMKAKAALLKAVEQLEEEEEVVEEEVEEEEEVVEEEEEVVEEEEEVVEEEEEVVEEEVEEEEVEEEELELEEFTYKNKTYYRDQNCNVYIADEDGAVDPNEVVGIWNPKTKKIDRVPLT
jgi:chromosome segregation ATPase